MACLQSIGTFGGCASCCQDVGVGSFQVMFVQNFPLTLPGSLVTQQAAFAAFINAIDPDTVALTPTTQIGINPGELWTYDYPSTQWSLAGSGYDLGVSGDSWYQTAGIDCDIYYYPFGINGFRSKLTCPYISCWGILQEVQYATGPNAPFIDYNCCGFGGIPLVLNFEITPTMYSHSDDSPNPSVGATSYFSGPNPLYFGTTYCNPPPNVNI